MNNFVQFIREQGVVGLAVGFILGGAVSALVSSFVQDIINPLVGLLFKTNETLATVSLGPVSIGSFIAVLIDFVIVAAVVYFIFKGLKLDKLDVKSAPTKTSGKK